MKTLQKRSVPVAYVDPNIPELLDEQEQKRCGTCWRLWPASQMTEEDGQDRCPECIEVRTPSYVAHTTAREQEYAASRVLRPQISKVPLGSTFPPTVVSMADGSGNAISQKNKLHLTRNVAASLVLSGRGFTASDSITYSSGLSNSVAPVTTPTLKTLSIVAALGATPGDGYGLTVAGVQFLNCISVR